MAFYLGAAIGGAAQQITDNRVKDRENAQRMLEKRMDYWMANGQDLMKERRTKKDKLVSIYNQANQLGLSDDQAEKL
ncbi:MAG TPA: hypothetical protein V6D20_00695, partial [Candidatus Obscuribacterales bacterium]